MLEKKLGPKFAQETGKNNSKHDGYKNKEIKEGMYEK